MKQIKTTQDLAEMYGSSDASSNDDQAVITKGVYKYTTCGAWIEFTPTGVVVGSIVEGIEECTPSHTLDYPFSQEAFSAALTTVEEEAAELWDNSHGCDDCGDPNPNELTPINPDCETCGGEGVIM